MDYDSLHARHSLIATLAGGQLLAHGIPSEEQAARIVANLPLFERKYGIAYTEECPGSRQYQWAYPNTWPPVVYMTLTGLARYGYHDHAARIADKFIRVTGQLFEKTGQLWEKTDAETGAVAGGEYSAAPMMGWSAGVYLALSECIAEAKPMPSIAESPALLLSASLCQPVVPQFRP
jgi:alpha,alpha-trehalase